MAHAVGALGAQPRTAAGRRGRLRLHGAGRRSPSSRHRRRVRLLLIVWPSRRNSGFAVFQPYRGWARATARSGGGLAHQVPVRPLR